MNLSDKFVDFVEKNKLFDKNIVILAGVSGGIDSVVMAHLFKRNGFNFAIAHCNFNLRGSESDQDSLFVENFAKAINVEFFEQSFNTQKYAEQNKISTQMAARDLRFRWFDEICKEKGFHKIAIAHSLDDNIETFFINILRGTGIKGLKGIDVARDNIVRPLLFASRAEITDFAKDNIIKYREDSSNISDKYLRNNIRHNLIPLLKTIQPDFEAVMENNIYRIGNATKVIDYVIENTISNVVRKEDEFEIIDISKIPSDEILTEIIFSYGFNYSTILNILANTESKEAKNFYSETYEAIVQNKEIALKKHTETKAPDFFKITSADDFQNPNLPFEINAIITDNTNDLKINKDSNYACLDFDKLKFPLILRKWKHGDKFIPFGMRGLKKISDFITDLKIPLRKKQNVWVLTSGEEILWIVGYRIDDRYKVSNSTKKILILIV